MSGVPNGGWSQLWAEVVRNLFKGAPQQKDLTPVPNAGGRG